MRDLIFISYSRKDKTFFEAFRKNLNPAESNDLLVWSDQKLEAGSKWEPRLREALAKTRVALLLVSDNFIDSKFIASKELPIILAAAEKGELKVFWVPITAALFGSVHLDEIAAAPGCDPRHPLDGMTRAKREQAVVTVCRAILDEMGRLPSMTRDDRGDLQQRVSQTVGAKYELLGEIGTGSSSIVYKAHSRPLERTVVVKTLVTDLTRSRERDVRERAKVAMQLTHPAYIAMYDEFIDREPYCVVTEYVDGVRLDQFRDTAGGTLTPRRVRRILLELAQALAEAHDHGVLHEGLTPSNVHIDRISLRPRISAFRFVNIGPSTGLWGTFLISHETCTYLSPEQFDGSPSTTATDQYALGLLGYELLSGHAVDRVTRPADFEHRRAFFAKLDQSQPWTERAPALAGIILGMLRVDPSLRWRSMAEVATLLEHVDVEDSADEAERRQVLDSYLTFQASDRTHKLYASFYKRLFAAVPDAKALFAGTEMPRQYYALHQALKVLLDYDPDSHATAHAIGAIAASHHHHGLGARHLDAFEQALLEALESNGVSDAATLQAWRKTLAPGLQHMRCALAAP
ncbi:MAG TPA: protein kinase, partial [Kofleriaceae bacterium]